MIIVQSFDAGPDISLSLCRQAGLEGWFVN